MLYGPPGTGKTSFVTALAGELKLNIYVISLANRGLTDETLTELSLGIGCLKTMPCQLAIVK